jgi:hypothetical protein
MRRVTLSLPSPAMVVALIALFAAPGRVGLRGQKDQLEADPHRIGGHPGG